MLFYLPYDYTNVNQTLWQNHMALHRMLHSCLGIVHYGIFGVFFMICGLKKCLAKPFFKPMIKPYYIPKSSRKMIKTNLLKGQE